MNDEELKHEFGLIRWWIFCMWICLSTIIFISGCAHLGIADRETMMERWRGQIAEKGINRNTLWEINEYANWYAQGETQYPVAIANEENLSGGFKPLPGKCVDQTELKLSISKELGIPAREGSCTIYRYDPWHPTGHAFAIVYLEGKSKSDDFDTWYVFDNGAVQSGIETYRDVKRTTWGAKNWRVE